MLHDVHIYYLIREVDIHHAFAPTHCPCSLPLRYNILSFSGSHSPLHKPGRDAGNARGILSISGRGIQILLICRWWKNEHSFWEILAPISQQNNNIQLKNDQVFGPQLGSKKDIYFTG